MALAWWASGGGSKPGTSRVSCSSTEAGGHWVGQTRHLAFCLPWCRVSLGVTVKMGFPRLRSRKGMFLVTFKNQRILDVLRISKSVKIIFIHQKQKRLTTVGLVTASYCWPAKPPKVYFILSINMLPFFS